MNNLSEKMLSNLSCILLIVGMAACSWEKNSMGEKVVLASEIQKDLTWLGMAQEASVPAATVFPETYFEQEIWELSVWSAYVYHESGGKACLYYADWTDEPQEIYMHDHPHESAGYYDVIYVGELWEDHSANWDYFCVSENADEVLWYDVVTCEAYTLEEWRASERYQSRMSKMEL